MIGHEPGTYTVEQKVSNYLYKFGHNNISAPSFLHVEKVVLEPIPSRTGLKLIVLKVEILFAPRTSSFSFR